MPRDQETTSEPVPVGTRTGAWPADTTTDAGPVTDAGRVTDVGPVTDAGSVTDVGPVTDAGRVAGASPATDPAVGTDPARVTVPDLGDPDLDAVPDAAASQSTGAVATVADTSRLSQPATGAHAAPPAAAGAAFVTGADGYRASWVRIQSGFVDDPRGSVTEAAALITQITSTLVSAVQERERTLRGAWDGSGDADTENLRNALRDYRSFFERLIGV
jgi:hypothetical protein